MRAADVFATDSDESEMLAELRTDLEQQIGLGAEIWQRQKQAHDVRYNRWEGQSADGRRHADALGREARPFEGAPDSRVPLVDSIINEKVATAVESFWRAPIQGTPIEPTDAPAAAGVSTLLRHLRDVVMREELETEVELSAQYLFGDDPGACVIAVDWLRDTQLERRLITYDELAAMYATGAASPETVDFSAPEPSLLGDFEDLITNPLRREEAVAVLARMFPSVSERLIRKAVKTLPAEGVVELAVPALRANRPCVTTLRLWDEVFFPVGTTDLQRARNIHRREWLTAAELRERVATADWDADEVEEVIARGEGVSLADDFTLSPPGNTSTTRTRATQEREQLYEIWWSYERRVDEMGVAGIWLFIWNSTCGDSFLKSELYAGPEGFYPFVLGVRERTGRLVLDSRGLTQPLATLQTEVKVQRDARGAYTQLVASPPKKKRVLAGTLEIVLGPDAEVPVMNMGDFELIQMPPFLAQSVEMETTTRHEAGEYAGRMTPEADPNRVAMLTQRDVNTVFRLWRAVFKQVLALCGRYYSPAELQRISGAPLDPEALTTNYDIAIEIDARDLNMDYAMKKLDAWTKLVGLDPVGVIGRTGMVEWGAQSLDPVLARRTLQPAEQVTQKTIDEEQDNVAKMAVGIEPHMPEQGVTSPKLRLETLGRTVMQSPQLSQAFAQNEGFRALMENRAKYLSQWVKQEDNKLVGRLGTMPLQGGA
jgi:hypothetical protein